MGAIIVTPTVVRTPTGQFALRGSTWRVADATHIEQKIPAWAVVLAIVLVPCTGFLSLLFLLAKENHYAGAVEVFVGNEGRQYTARVPVSSPEMVQAIYNQVNHFQSVAGRV